jgi:hypothetical protein
VLARVRLGYPLLPQVNANVDLPYLPTPSSFHFLTLHTWARGGGYTTLVIFLGLPPLDLLPQRSQEDIPYNFFYKRAWSGNLKMVRYVLLQLLRPELDGQPSSANFSYLCTKLVTTIFLLH